MDLLLQVSEKELEEFPKLLVDQIDKDKPDKSNPSETHSSNISPQLQAETNTVPEAPKVSTTSSCNKQKCRYKQLATWPVILHTFAYWKGQPVACPYPLIADATGGTQLTDILQDSLSRSSKVFTLRNPHR